MLVAKVSLHPAIKDLQQKQRLREAPKLQAQRRAQQLERAKALVDANQSMKDLQTAIALIEGARREDSMGSYRTWPESDRTALTEIKDEANKRMLLREKKAEQAEAELMAMLEGEEQGAAASGAKAAEKAHKKKEKRQRQLQKRAQAKGEVAAIEKAKNPEKRWSAEKNAWVTEVVHCADT